MNKISLKFYLPFERNDEKERERLISLDNETAHLFSPYHSVGIVVGENEEIKLPIACIKVMELSEKALGLPDSAWKGATTLNAPGAGELPGRKDLVSIPLYEDKSIAFNWKSLDKEKIYACLIYIDLG